MKKRLPRTGEFLDGVYEWLCEPRNRSVEDLHYMEASIMSKENFRSYIRSFLEQRLSQTVNVSDYPQDKVKVLLDISTIKYIKSMF